MLGPRRSDLVIATAGPGPDEAGTLGPARRDRRVTARRVGRGCWPAVASGGAAHRPAGRPIPTARRHRVHLGHHRTPKGAVFCGRQIAFITRPTSATEWGGGGTALVGSALAHLGPTTKLAGNLRAGCDPVPDRTWHAADALRRIADSQISRRRRRPDPAGPDAASPTSTATTSRCVKAIVIGGGPATPAWSARPGQRFGAPLGGPLLVHRGRHRHRHRLR